MFTQECFIRKNTKKLRDKLDLLGYHRIENGVNEWRISIENCTCLTTDVSVDNAYMGNMGSWGKISIDCGTNEEMFLALAALRDDSDRGQLFVKKDSFDGDCFDRWYLCHSDKISDELISFKEYHKATPKEIVEHFTRKEK